MRNFLVRLEIDIFAIEYDPFSIGRRHRRADAFELHHVFKGEWMFAAGGNGRGCLSEKQSCEHESDCDKNFHKRQSSREFADMQRSARVAHASRVLVSASRRNSLFSEVRDCETQSPTRETRALPGILRTPDVLTKRF